MAVVVDALARFAQPIVLLVTAALTAGVSLTVLRLPLVGWSLYTLGYIGLLLALPALAAAYRASLDRLTWLTVGLLWAGLIVGLPVVLILIGHYLANPELPDAVLPHTVTDLALLAAVTWTTLGFFGLAAFQSVNALPRVGAVLVVAGALVALAAEFALLGVFSWAFGIILASVGLVWMAPQPEPEPESAAT